MKNKILTISIIFILLSFIFINSCFAYSSSNSVQTLFSACTNYLDDHNITYYDYVVLEKYNAKEYIFIFLTNSNYTFKANTSKNYISANYNIIFHFDSNEEDLSVFSSNTGSTVYDIFSLSMFYPTYSTFDIYNSSNALFFQLTPVPPSTLVEALEISKPKETFQTMMSGIIPYLIALVVGLVAFWKAWQLLLKELRRA